MFSREQELSAAQDDSSCTTTEPRSPWVIAAGFGVMTCFLAREVARFWCCVNARSLSAKPRERQGQGKEEGLKGAKADSEKSTRVKNQELQKELLLVPLLHSTLGFRQRFVA